jgi:tetratricopeptide (TPR) repeat protein
MFSCSGGGGDEENSFQAYEDAYKAYMSGEKPAKEVLPDVKQYVSEHKGEEVGYLFLAHLQVESDQLKEAEASYQKAIEINERSFEAFNGIGYIYLNQGYYDSAISYMEKALEYNEKNPYSEANMAVCYLFEGDTIRSIELINASLEKERTGHNTAVALLLTEALPGMEVAEVTLDETDTLNKSFETAAYRALKSGSGFPGWLKTLN